MLLYRKNNLGIVCEENIKNKDLEKIVSNNVKFVENFINYRYFISNEYHINQLIIEYNLLKV